MNNQRIHPILQALLAALLFGASTPFAKLLLGKIDPIPLASFLYLGSGIGLLTYRFIQHKQTGYIETEAKINQKEIKWIVGAVIAGGILAPIVLLFSLRSTPASTASLLLNFESVATTIIAVFAFKESIGKQIGFAIAFITCGSILLTWDMQGNWGLSTGAIGILLTCTLWGIDNNFTRNISAKDPFIIVTIKGIVAGLFSLLLAILTRSSFPSFIIIIEAMLLGLFSYGISIVLFIFAMRNLGASRASAFFGTAPFVGALFSFVLFHERPHSIFYIALPIMIFGAVLLFREKHEHEHWHKRLEHEHRHNHDDEHHDHSHPDQKIMEHSHIHLHADVEHGHAHTPDIHHRH